MNTVFDPESFRGMLEHQWAMGHVIGVGLSDHSSLLFNKGVIEATEGFACAYELCIDPGEAYEKNSVALQTIACVHRISPKTPVIVRVNIKNITLSHARMVFNDLDADALITHPYLDGIQQFMATRGIVVPCCVSDRELQDLKVRPSWKNMKKWGVGPMERIKTSVVGMPFYQLIALRVAKWRNPNAMLAINFDSCSGEKLRGIRGVAPNVPILIRDVHIHDHDDNNDNVRRIIASGKDNRRRGLIVGLPRDIVIADGNTKHMETIQGDLERLHKTIRDAW